MYIKYAEIQNGEVACICETILSEYERLVASGATTVRIADEENLDTFLNTHYLSGTIWKNRTPSPSPYHEWDVASESWLPNLDAAKAAKKAEIEAERNSRISEPLIYDGKVLDADQAARDNLKAKLEEVRERVRLNMPMAPELLVWRDNGNQTYSWPTIEAYHDWLAGYAVAMSDRGTRCYACAWYHKDVLEQLSVLEDIINYDLIQGWPE